LPTASVIKVPLLAEVYRQVADGAISLEQRLTMQASDIVGGSGVLKEFAPGLTPTVHDLAMMMVVVSDNTATNMLTDLVGGVERVNALMQDLGLTSIAYHIRIDFEVIGDDVRRLGESSAVDMARLMELIATGAVAGPEASAGMINILRRQQYLDQVPRYFNYNPYAQDLALEQPYSVACKTGFFPGTRVDAGLLFLPQDVTIAYCAMTDGSADTSISAEAEGLVTNGLLGRLMLEYWWPNGTLPDSQVVASPYVDAIWN
jgi:beta-lactamase class A